MKIDGYFSSILFALFIFATISGCSKDGTDAVTLKVAGSTTVLPIVTKAANLFKANNPGVEITINSGGSGVGVTYASDGMVDIGMVSRSILNEELNKYSNVDIQVHTIGMDAVACAVSSEVFDSGVTHLDKETIADIYSGKITNWSQLGGLDRDILVIDKEHHRGTRHVFMGYVMGDKNAKASGADLVTGSNNELQSKIIASDSAIGMLSMAWLNDDVKGMSIKVDGGLIESTVENVRNGSYPIARELNLVTVGEPKGVLKDFIDFIKSEEGRKITEESGYVPVI